MRFHVDVRRLPYPSPPHPSTPAERAGAPKKEAGFDVEAENRDDAKAAVLERLRLWGEKHRALTIATSGQFIVMLYAKPVAA